MSKSDAAETAFLTLVFNNTDWANIGDATGLRGSTGAGSLYVALHTADPTDAGNATAFECAYAGPYARQAVARSGAGWTVSGDTVSNAALIQFPQCSGGSETATHASVTTAASGTSVILWSGALSAPLSISAGIQPQIAAGALDITEG